MTAQVEVFLDRKESVLGVPPEAVARQDGREVCFVVHEDGLERRQVKLGHSTQNILEISEGLSEGEQIVMNPALVDLENDITLETPLRDESPITKDRGPWELEKVSEPSREVALIAK